MIGSDQMWPVKPVPSLPAGLAFKGLQAHRERDNIRVVHVVPVETVKFGQEIQSLWSCECDRRFRSVVKV